MPVFEHQGKSREYPTIYSVTIYERYRKRFEKKHKNPLFLNYKLFNTLIKRYHQKWINAIIKEGAIYTMPFRLGKLYVAKVKPELYYNEDGTIDYKKSKLGVDFNKTKKYGKTMYHLNTHTKGYKMSFNWQKKDAAKVPNITFFELRIAIKNKKKLNETIKDKFVKGEVDYIDYRSIHNIGEKQKNYGQHKLEKQD